jgi:branched-chain amino acid transport system permease protein
MGVGALSAAHLQAGWGVPFLVAVPLGAVAAVPVGLIAAIPALRLRGIQLAIVTLAYGQLLQRLFFDAPVNGGSLGGVPLHRPGVFSGDVAYARMELVVFAALAALVTLMASRRTGRNLTLLRESETAALAAGVDLTRAKLAVFAVSAAIAGLAGGLLAGVGGVATPDDFTPFASIGLLAVGVIGGLQTAVGAAAGGLLRACGPSWIAQVPLISRAGDAASIVFGAGLVLALLTAPRGVAGQVRDGERWLARLVRRLLGPATRLERD